MAWANFRNDPDVGYERLVREALGLLERADDLRAQLVLDATGRDARPVARRRVGANAEPSRRRVRGTAVALSWWWLAVVGLAGVYFLYSAAVEEHYMTDEFPDDYPPYKRSTKMLLPFIL